MKIYLISNLDTSWVEVIYTANEYALIRMDSTKDI